jgi:hypothetical protein
MTADTVIDVHFSHKERTPILGDPSYADLHDRHQKLKTNAVNVPTQLTPGNLGLLPLIISPTDYVNVELVPTATKPHAQVNGIIRKHTTKIDLVKYHHSSLGSPIVAALLNGIKKISSPLSQA